LRKLSLKFPPPGDGKMFALGDDVALKYFRLQQVNEGAIDLSQGEAEPLKGPTDVGTAGEKDVDVALSTLVEKLNERFGTDFTEADQLFFDQVRATAETNEKIIEAAHANSFENFSSYLRKVLDDLFIERMEGNEAVFSRVMGDVSFREAVLQNLGADLYERIRNPANLGPSAQPPPG